MARSGDGREDVGLYRCKAKAGRLSEFEIVGAINHSFVRAAVRDCAAALLFGGGRRRLERGKTKTQILNIARFAQTFMVSRFISASVFSSG